VIGKVIETEDKVLIPVAKMGMGFGAGMGEGNGPESQGSGLGAGAAGAAGMKPIAMIVIFKDVPGSEGVKLVSLSSCPMAQAMSEIGSAFVDMMKENHMMKEKWIKKYKEKKEKSREKGKP